MAYQVLKYPFSRSEGRARKEYALEAPEPGNRKTAQEAAEEATAYDANNLNQYTAIQTGEEAAFVPTFDADGKAPDGCKGDWTNTECLPRRGEDAMGCARVNMGRCHTRKITVHGSVTIDLRSIYRGYLQIAAINAESGVFQWFIRRESARWPRLGRLREQAVRAMSQMRSVCPAGASARGAAASQSDRGSGESLDKRAAFARRARSRGAAPSQPIQWSSEYNDRELDLIYYNYRYDNPADGRWIYKDREIYSINLYLYSRNAPILYIDRYGLAVEEPYLDYDVDYLEKIGPMLTFWGSKLGLSENDIIATGMAIAEEYSARQDHLGIKGLIDRWQDFECEKGWISWYFTDFGKANINQHTAQSVDLFPLEKVDRDLKEGIARILEDVKSTRAFIVTDDGTVLLSLLIMLQTVGGTSPYTEGMQPEERAHVNVNAWREGPMILDRMERNKNAMSAPSSYKPSSGKKKDLVRENYETAKSALRL